jgi:hypothetical protein
VYTSEEIASVKSHLPIPPISYNNQTWVEPFRQHWVGEYTVHDIFRNGKNWVTLSIGKVIVACLAGTSIQGL